MSHYNSIQKELVDRTRDSLTVEIDRAFSWVKIQSKFDRDSYCFLQGHEAEDFITEVDSNDDKFPDELFVDNELLAAYVYVDCLPD